MVGILEVNLNTTGVVIAIAGFIFVLAAVGDKDPRDVIRNAMGKESLYSSISDGKKLSDGGSIFGTVKKATQGFGKKEESDSITPMTPVTPPGTPVVTV